MKEIWKDVPNYKNLYKVSTLGRIKSLTRVNSLGHNIKGRILKQSNSGNRYSKVSLYKNGKNTTTVVHQLMMVVFKNHKPNGYKLIVNHINFDRKDNRLENLEITTTRENTNKIHLKSKSKYVGVNYNNGKWSATIFLNKKSNYLGTFKNEKEASYVYIKALNLIKQNKSIQPIIDKFKPKFTSKYKGISFHKLKNKWLSYVVDNGKQIYLGYFNTESDAYKARENYIKI